MSKNTNTIYALINEKHHKLFSLNNINIAAIMLLYLLSIITTPIAVSINSNHAFFNKNYLHQNKINLNNTLLINGISHYPTYNRNNINTATYITQDQMIARQIDDNNFQSFISDDKGSVLKLNYSSDKTNNRAYSYDPYGKPIPISNPVWNITNSFMYDGERFDINTRLQYLRARFYNSSIKRFINQDSYDFFNRFNYVDDNPVMEVDPSGHMREFFRQSSILEFGEVTKRRDIMLEEACIFTQINNKNSSALSRLATVSEKQQSSENNIVCSICISDIKRNNIFNLRCGHMYHKSCIEQWVYKHGTCPLCRQPAINLISFRTIISAPVHMNIQAELALANYIFKHQKYLFLDDNLDPILPDVEDTYAGVIYLKQLDNDTLLSMRNNLNLEEIYLTNVNVELLRRSNPEAIQRAFKIQQ